MLIFEIKKTLFLLGIITPSKIFIRNSIKVNDVKIINKLLRKGNYFDKLQTLDELTSENIRNSEILKSVIYVYKNSDVRKLKLQAAYLLQKYNADVPNLDLTIKKLSSSLKKNLIKDDYNNLNHLPTKRRISNKLLNIYKRQQW